MRTAGERTVFCAMAVIAAISAHATLAHAGQPAAKMSFVVKLEADKATLAHNGVITNVVNAFNLEKID